jgi:YVTN family beta-propeller protein
MLKRVVFVVGALSALGACVATRSLIDTASDHVVASIDVGANPHGLAISDDGSRVLVSGWGSNEAEVIDTSTGRVIGSVPVAQPHNGTLSRDVRVGWVASQKQDATALVRLDLAMWKEVARVPLNETPRGLELSPDGRRIFFTLAGVNAIQVLDTTTNQIVGASPHYPPFTPDGRWALAVVQGPGELGILNTANNTLAGLVLLGKAPHWSASSADGRLAFVTNEGSNDVSMVDVESRTVTATIAVGNAPRKIAMQPMSGTDATTETTVRTNTARAETGKSLVIDGVSYANHGTKDVRNLSKLELEADDYYFSPRVRAAAVAARNWLEPPGLLGFQRSATWASAPSQCRRGDTVDLASTPVAWSRKLVSRVEGAAAICEYPQPFRSQIPSRSGAPTFRAPKSA